MGTDSFRRLPMERWFMENAAIPRQLLASDKSSSLIYYSTFRSSTLCYRNQMSELLYESKHFPFLVYLNHFNRLANAPAEFLLTLVLTYFIVLNAL